MSERMKALPFLVYELFTKNCKKCRIETLPISVSNFQFLIQGKEKKCYHQNCVVLEKAILHNMPS